MTEHRSNTNRLCPDPSAHWQNAAERLGFSPDAVLSADDSDAVDAAAEDESQACEGHQ